ncbi:MAG TPA: Arc family DNA-binding protein [Longimicrobium sp.]|jgi:plasmid stability protein
MATMTLKNVPDALYEQLKTSAERNRRSINSEAIVCLERALRGTSVDAASVLARARELRGRMGGLFVDDEDLRAARDEGRP